MEIVAWEHIPQKTGKKINDDCIGYKIMRYSGDGYYRTPFIAFKAIKRGATVQASGINGPNKMPIKLPYRFGFHCFVSWTDAASCTAFSDPRNVICKVKMRRLEAAGFWFGRPCVVAREITILEEAM